MNFWEEVLKRVSTAGDLGVVLVAFAASYVLEFKVHLLGMEPGRTGIILSAAAFGLKKIGEGAVSEMQNVLSAVMQRGFRGKDLQAAHREVERRVTQIDGLLSGLGDAAPVHLLKAASRLRSDFELWKKELVSDDVMKRSTDEFIVRYRTFREQEIERAEDAKHVLVDH